MSNQKHRGFTLIELMIAVAVIAILAAIAIPNFSSHTIKARNAAAQAFLMDIAQRQEQYLLDNRSYAPDLATLLPNVAAADRVPREVDQFYDLQAFVMGGGNASYQIVLIPTAGGKMDGSGPYQGTLVISNTSPNASISN